TSMYTTATPDYGNWATRIFSLNLSGDSALPYAFAGNDTIAPDVVFFETQGEAENYSSIVWTTGGDGNFITNYAEHVIYLRGPGDLSNGYVILTMNLTGYYEGTWAADSMTLIFDPTTGLEEAMSEEPDLSIIPNPSHGLVTIQANTGVNKNVTLYVFNSGGKLLFKEETTTNSEKFTRNLDFSYKETGVYYILLRAGNQKVSGNMVVVR
ncbi:MAG: T9SS type A sorting domain-containing protein, partial [Chlorobi bacterium]|nr:T9SS type A sorting domain-containing protein [Chlorobiota bacterium]